MQVKKHLKRTILSTFDLVHVVSTRRESSDTMINVLPAPLYKAAVEILDTISGVVYTKITHLVGQLLTKLNGITTTLIDRRILCNSLSAMRKITWDTGRL